MLSKFPFNENTNEKDPSIRLFGKRFHKDQTVTEYLAEFLLAFSSEKIGIYQGKGIDLNCFPNESRLYYKPKTKLSLKLFTFFTSSKLETRHNVHTAEFKSRIKGLKNNIKHFEDTSLNADNIIKIIQNILIGFTGISGNRTWCTRNFLPVTNKLLACEVMWNHTQTKNQEFNSWEETEEYYATDKHNFMARGGEILFLQLLNLFHNYPNEELKKLLLPKAYNHLNIESTTLKKSLDSNLNNMLTSLDKNLGQIISFIEETFGSNLTDENRQATFGWIYSDTIKESALFAWELNNICSANIDTLKKIELLEVLCALQVLRSISFQSSKYCDYDELNCEFVGQYYWILTPPKNQNRDLHKVAVRNYHTIEKMIFSALRNEIFENGPSPKDDDAYKLFRKLAKDIGLVVPRTGTSMRFTVNKSLIKTFVLALVPPGTRLRVDSFFERMYLHYGIALDHKNIKEAISWSFLERNPDGNVIDNEWIIDILKEAGFLITLSDSLSIVYNPFGSN